MTRLDMDYNRVPPQRFVAALHTRTTVHDVWVSSSAGAPNYGQLDWFAVARHAAALKWASVIDAPCEWLHCVGAAVNGTFLMRPNGQPVATMQNERLLVEWALAQGLHINLLTNIFLSSTTWRLKPPGKETQSCHPLAISKGPKKLPP